MSTKKASKPKHHGINKSNASTNPFRVVPKGIKHFRDKATIMRLNMYSKGKSDFRSRDLPNARIEPNRRWFGNTRVIDQEQLEKFKDEYQKVEKNPYQFVLFQKQLPVGLLKPNVGAEAFSGQFKKVSLLTAETFEETFSSKRRRKKPKLAEGFEDIESFVQKVDETESGYSSIKDSNLMVNRETDGSRNMKRDIMFEKGQSRRIWSELYKVIDSSDVLIEVLDARDPIGTRSKHIEDHLKKERKHKQLIIVLNKCDLVPTWVTARWVQLLSREYPTLAFHASLNNSFGKGALIQLLRQFARLHSDKRQISVGFIGYPNVGKSSIINTLKKKKVCKVAPIPGETKVWQYITLFKRVFLIDCPGVVYDTGDNETATVLKGVVRIENIKDPSLYIPDLMTSIKPEYLQHTYGINSWKDPDDFLKQFCFKSGRLLPGREPDIDTAAKMILSDWLRGKLPFFCPPPFDDEPIVNARAQVGSLSFSGESLANAVFNSTLANADSIDQGEGEDVKSFSLGDSSSNKNSRSVSAKSEPTDEDGEDVSDEDSMVSSTSETTRRTLPGMLPVVQEFKRIRVCPDFLHSDMVAPSHFAPNEFVKETMLERIVPDDADDMNEPIDEDFEDLDDMDDIDVSAENQLEEGEEPAESDDEVADDKADAVWEEMMGTVRNQSSSSAPVSAPRKSFRDRKLEQQRAMNASVPSDSEDERPSGRSRPRPPIKKPKQERKKVVDDDFEGDDDEDDDGFTNNDRFEIVGKRGKVQVVGEQKRLPDGRRDRRPKSNKAKRLRTWAELGTPAPTNKKTKPEGRFKAKSKDSPKAPKPRSTRTAKSPRTSKKQQKLH
eukprot:TRINITY_DN498_c0_g1_i1.p1 TRINITY_DN498_c0_g1~~TRINITY_DN498_c0_g1_i1.p1  ORF type:complete len:890 (+),score=478.58 TRINITY_DN498_c0_g1_i1:167-2671(+)